MSLDPTFLLTPLGAAFVEALPDRKRAAKIKRDFRRSGRCPTSLIFPTAASVAKFYLDNLGAASRDKETA